MERLFSGKRLWWLFGALVLVLAVLLASMSLASAQTATPTGTASFGGTATAVGTTSLGGTATPLATTSLGGTATPLATTSLGGMVTPLATTSLGGTVTPSMTTSPLTTPAATRAITSTATTTTTLQLTLPQRPYLPLNLALRAANAALSKCDQGGYKVTVTVVDAEGVQKVVLSQDGANPATQTGSYRKAFTAASLGSPTSAAAATIASNPGLANLDERILGLAGGLPIIANNQLVGGIGVSGAPSGTLDETCARAGLDSLR